MLSEKNKASQLLDLGQLLIIGFDGTKMSRRLSSLLAWLQPAGVILFARNIKNPQQVWELLRDCRENVSMPLFACVDLEGGVVDRFRDVLGPTPSAGDVFATADRRLFRKHGQLIGENCHALGFNIDFAPVLDLAFDASRNVMGSRAVSRDPEKTAAYAREVLAGLKQAGILGCGKHFPGLGEGNLDSHYELPVITKPLREIWAEDLVPYRRLRAQMPMVMVSHASYPSVTGSQIPASLSQVWMNNILRKRIAYRNLIVSDDLEMGGVLSAASTDSAAVGFIRAGGDLCLVCHREDRVTDSYEKLLRTTEQDRKFAERAADSIRRVIAFKKRYAELLRPARQPSQATVDKLSRALWEFGEHVRLAVLDRVEEIRAQDTRLDSTRSAKTSRRTK